MKKIIAGIVVILVLGATGYFVRKTDNFRLPVNPPVTKTFVPLSFIPGGVRSVEQFRAALAADKDLVAQFPDFDFSKARFERLGRPVCAFIAYRNGKDFRWTKGCKPLPADTLVITDGKTYIRARCGNKISFSPQAPTIDSDVDEAFDFPPTAGDVPPASPAPIFPTPISTPVTTIPSEPMPLPPCMNCAGYPVFVPIPVSTPVRMDAGDGYCGIAMCFGLLSLFLAQKKLDARKN
jgi:hypothetical protein